MKQSTRKLLAATWKSELIWLNKPESHYHCYRKFENSNDMLICSVDSPLFPFLMARHLQVYLRELPQGMTDGICLKMLVLSLVKCCGVLSLSISECRNHIHRNIRLWKSRVHSSENQKNSWSQSSEQVSNPFDDWNYQRFFRKLLELEKLCARSWVPEDDIVFKSCRTSDETLALAEALELQWPYSNEDIVNRVNEMRAKREEIK